MSEDPDLSTCLKSSPSKHQDRECGRVDPEEGDEPGSLARSIEAWNRTNRSFAEPVVNCASALKTGGERQEQPRGVTQAWQGCVAATSVREIQKGRSKRIGKRSDTPQPLDVGFKRAPHMSFERLHRRFLPTLDDQIIDLEMLLQRPT